MYPSPATRHFRILRYKTSSMYAIIVLSKQSQKQPSGGQFGPHRDESSNMGANQFLPVVALKCDMSQLPALEEEHSKRYYSALDLVAIAC